MANTISSTTINGARLLREIKSEEGTLSELLKDLRTTQTPHPSRTGIPSLDALWHHHGSNSKLSITGRGLPLLYHIIEHMISTLHGTVVVIDIDGRFSPSHLRSLGEEGLRHIHVFRATGENLGVTLEGVEWYMLWGKHGSKGREWVGTLVNGGVGGDVIVGWRGWLRVEREEVGGFPVGVSVEEVLGEREVRQDVVDKTGWKGASEMGEYCWK